MSFPRPPEPTIPFVLVLCFVLVFLAGCQSAEVREESTPQVHEQALLRPVEITGVGLVACINTVPDGASEWRSVCARLGRFVPCYETRTHIHCDGGRSGARM